MVVEVSVEETVRRIVTRIVRVPDLEYSLGASFKDLGADSLDIVQVLVAIEDTYGIEISDDELKGVNNLGQFIAGIERKLTEKDAGRRQC